MPELCSAPLEGGWGGGGGHLPQILHAGSAIDMSAIFG